jgi:hypothetical protein
MNENVKVYRILISIVFLLMMGVSQGWAGTREYTVKYTGVPEGKTGGYTIINATLPNGSITSGDDANTFVTSRQSGTPTELTTDNILTYISPKSIDGYYSTVSVSSS